MDVFIFVVLCSLLPLLLTMSEQSMIASDSAHLNEIKNKEPRSHVQRLEIQFCCRTSLASDNITSSMSHSMISRPKPRDGSGVVAGVRITGGLRWSLLSPAGTLTARCRHSCRAIPVPALVMYTCLKCMCS